MAHVFIFDGFQPRFTPILSNPSLNIQLYHSKMKLFEKSCVYFSEHSGFDDVSMNAFLHVQFYVMISVQKERQFPKPV